HKLGIRSTPIWFNDILNTLLRNHVISLSSHLFSLVIRIILRVNHTTTCSLTYEDCRSSESDTTPGGSCSRGSCFSFRCGLRLRHKLSR
ncbi:hypothetical protein LINPERHAP1_LOCUS18647, partial [Linum perenne]